MSDRLDDLRRQRALVAEHLAWLDREIAAAQAAAPKPALPAPATAPVVIAPRKEGLSAPAAPATTKPDVVQSGPTKDDRQADDILSNYRVEPNAMKSDIKKGCFLYFFGALALVALVVAVLYFALTKR
jgi:hypothetical protein